MIDYSMTDVNKVLEEAMRLKKDRILNDENILKNTLIKHFSYYAHMVRVIDYDRFVADHELHILSLHILSAWSDTNFAFVLEMDFGKIVYLVRKLKDKEWKTVYHPASSTMYGGKYIVVKKVHLEGSYEVHAVVDKLEVALSLVI